MEILEQAYIRDRYKDAIQNIKYDENKFVNKGYYMKQIKQNKYGNSCWSINEHIKHNDNILKIIAWQMKIDHYIYKNT